jgi:hypothetical protein
MPRKKTPIVNFTDIFFKQKIQVSACYGGILFDQLTE